MIINIVIHYNNHNNNNHIRVQLVSGVDSSWTEVQWKLSSTDATASPRCCILFSSHLNSLFGRIRPFAALTGFHVIGFDLGSQRRGCAAVWLADWSASLSRPTLSCFSPPLHELLTRSGSSGLGRAELARKFWLEPASWWLLGPSERPIPGYLELGYWSWIHCKKKTYPMWHLLVVVFNITPR